MSIRNYIEKIKLENKITYKQLAKELGMTYQNLLDIRKNKVNLTSSKVIDALAKYEDCPPKDIYFKIIKMDMPQNSKVSDYALKTICDYYINNYAITLSQAIKSPILNNKIPLEFNGIGYKKGCIKEYIAFDAWSHLKNEHDLIMHDTNNATILYKNTNSYLTSILGFTLMKAQSTKEYEIRTYVIIFNKNDVDALQLNYLRTLLPEKSRIKLILHLED